MSVCVCVCVYVCVYIYVYMYIYVYGVLYMVFNARLPVDVLSYFSKRFVHIVISLFRIVVLFGLLLLLLLWLLLVKGRTMF